MNPLFNMLQSMTNYKLRESLDRRRKDVITEDGMDPLTEEGYDPEFVASAVAEDVREVSEVLNAFATGKYCGESHKIKDVMTSTDFPNIIGAATEILMMNRIVPQRIVSSNLFQTIPYDGDATQLTIRTLGGVQVKR